MNTKRTHRWALAAVVSAALVPATPATGQGGGAPAPGPGSGAEAVDPGFTLSSRRGVFVGKALRVRGAAAEAAGRPVRIDRLDPSGLWLPVSSAQAGPDGSFEAVIEPDVPGRYLLRAVLGGDASSAQTGAARSSVPRSVTVYRAATASWYGPGFYGRRTACGLRLGRGTLGVAHRRLPCGTRVALHHRGRSIVVRVIDRGPFVRGVQWDLTGATARRLGVTATSRIGAAPLR